MKINSFLLLLVFMLPLHALDYNDGVPILDPNAEVTEEQERAIINGAELYCDDKENKEQCIYKYYEDHNFEFQADCD